MNRHTWNIVSFSAGLCIATWTSSTARAEDEEPFRLGGSCAALAFTTQSQLSEILTASYADDLGSFCVPEEPFECGDYSSLLKGMGRLTTGEDGFHCTLQLHR